MSNENNVIMAFRKRMKFHGYGEIHIKSLGQDLQYRVSGIEPLSGTFVERILSVYEMQDAFRFGLTRGWARPVVEQDE